MLCKIWGFHGGDYEECRLLVYKNPVRTSQETHYVSATEFSRLTLCKIRGLLGGDYEECRLLECYAVWLLYFFAACVGCLLRLTLFLLNRGLSPWWWWC
jgi:hypothetical protein